MNRFVIDRFEGKYAVCEQTEDKAIINIPRYKVPIDAKEGDFLALENGFYVLSKEDTQSQKSKMKKLMQELKRKK